MVRVCEKELPLEFVRKQKPRARYPGFYMHEGLKQQLDIYLKNIKNDWDFVIVISGEGEVRVGKSYIAAQIARYWTSEVRRLYGKETKINLKDNFVFKGDKLIEKGNKLGVRDTWGSLVFDEAGADLEGVKSMKRTTQNVKDYLRECGQYNMLTILVLPEFFDLPKGVAVSRSSCLINVYWLGDNEGNMNRGYFKFYSRPNKKNLYLKGKKNLDYTAWGQDFFGSFDNLFPLDLEEYKGMKKKALKDREKGTKKEVRMKELMKGCFKYMQDQGLTFVEMSEEVSKRCSVRMSRMYPARLLGNVADSREKSEEDETVGI